MSKMRAYLGLVAATLVAGVMSEQHILLDSTKESMLDWFKYPKGPQSPTPGKYSTRLVPVSGWSVNIRKECGSHQVLDTAEIYTCNFVCSAEISDLPIIYRRLG